jgi:hypothetical protein
LSTMAATGTTANTPTSTSTSMPTSTPTGLHTGTDNTVTDTRSSRTGSPPFTLHPQAPTGNSFDAEVIHPDITVILREGEGDKRGFASDEAIASFQDPVDSLQRLASMARRQAAKVEAGKWLSQVAVSMALAKNTREANGISTARYAATTSCSRVFTCPPTQATPCTRAHVKHAHSHWHAPKTHLCTASATAGTSHFCHRNA